MLAGLDDLVRLDRVMGNAVASTFVIAEAGVNHNGSLDTAKKLVDEARAACADAVKFQAFRADRLVSARAAKATYQKRSTGGDESQLAMLRALELDAAGFRQLAEHALDVGIEFLSTPFDIESVAMLVDLGVRRLKIGSGDATNAPLLRAAARTGLPLVLSSGMCTLADCEAMLAVVAAGYLEASRGERVDPTDALLSPEGQALLEQRVTLLHCTTEYPAALAETNLRVMPMLRDAFGVSVGYSDHTEGIAVPLAAVALGATVIEKHFTLSRELPGPDHVASLEPSELREMVAGIRAVELALGRSFKRPSAAERANAVVARRSVVAARRIARGERITADMLDTKRPADGVSPMRADEIVGRNAARDYQPDEALEL